MEKRLIDSPHRGRVALVTGASSGIGLVTARRLAELGMHVFLAGRSELKTRQVISDIVGATGNPDVEFIPLDLGELSTVRACAQQFLRRQLPLHLLINNAGLAGHRGMTGSGFEITFGTNHIGPFLLTNLLLSRLVQSGPARVVTVASDSHYAAATVDFERVRQPTQSLTGTPEYRVSKLANVLFSNELARRLAGTQVTTYALHPGTVATEIWRRLPRPMAQLIKGFMITPEEGAETTLYCATSDEVARHSGRYYDKCAEKLASAVASDEDLARELWARSEAWVGSAAPMAKANLFVAEA